MSTNQIIVSPRLCTSCGSVIRQMACTHSGISPDWDWIAWRTQAPKTAHTYKIYFEHRDALVQTPLRPVQLFEFRQVFPLHYDVR